MERESFRTTQIGLGRTAAPGCVASFMQASTLPGIMEILFSPPQTGEVAIVDSWPASCGNGVMIRHRQFERFTVYCHLQEIGVRMDQMVKRGDVIGLMGVTGDARGCKPECPHVHFELSSVAHGHPSLVPGVTFDPLPMIIGCFDPSRTYASDRLVLTHPIQCRNQEDHPMSKD